jgi:hypothetical protein
LRVPPPPQSALFTKMDDLLLDLFPPTNDFSSTDADIPFDAWIAQFDAFADEPPEPAQTQVPLIEELPEEESTLAPEPSMDPPSHPPKLLPSGPIESSARRRKPLYKPTCAILINSKRVNKKPMEKGNNVYGRTGTLRCELCRKRRLKVPHSPASPWIEERSVHSRQLTRLASCAERRE